MSEWQALGQRDTERLPWRVDQLKYELAGLTEQIERLETRRIALEAELARLTDD